MDRSGLILDIFADRARSSQAKAQVELAQLEYLRSRLTRAWTHLERQKGGIGMRGPGETQIETDRRLIGKRIAVLKDQLDKIDRQRTTQRKGRSDETRGGPRRLHERGEEHGHERARRRERPRREPPVRDARRDPRGRWTSTPTSRSSSPTPSALSASSPHSLVESFKSTLDETREADLLLHVVDVTHPNAEDHVRVVNETLKELGALDKPTLMVFNKVDALNDRGLLDALRAQYDEAVFISAARGIGLDALRDRTLALVESDYVDRTALLPVTEAKAPRPRPPGRRGDGRAGRVRRGRLRRERGGACPSSASGSGPRARTCPTSTGCSSATAVSAGTRPSRTRRATAPRRRRRCLTRPSKPLLGTRGAGWRARPRPQW